MTTTSTTEPVRPDGWNIAELAGGMLFSSDDFILQLSTTEVDKFIDILNSQNGGQVRDSNGDVVDIAVPNREHVILRRVNDKTYPNGIILPVDAFSEVDDGDEPVIEGIRPAFRRVGTKIKRGYRVTSGRHKGQVVVHPETANKPPLKAVTRAKLKAAAHRTRLIRALKSKLTRKKPASLKLRRLNHTD